MKKNDNLLTHTLPKAWEAMFPVRHADFAVPKMYEVQLRESFKKQIVRVA